MYGLKLASFFLLTAAAAGQTTRVAFVQSVGTGSVSVKPDQAIVQLSVVTSATTAQGASTQNATTVNNVLNQLGALLGASADIKTVSYTLSANYSYPQGQTPVLQGYTANNTIQATTGDLAIVGSIIDTGIQAGANQVSSLRFGLKNDQDAKTQALKLATAQAKAHADAMAAGMGMHTGAVQGILEGSTSSAISPLAGTAAVASSTPVVSGTLEVSASVTLSVAIVP